MVLRPLRFRSSRPFSVSSASFLAFWVFPPPPLRIGLEFGGISVGLRL
jgi:hypothetical protein